MFPETEKLLTLERKYGDSLNHEDLHGVAKPKKRKIAPDGTVTAESPDKATEGEQSKFADGSMVMNSMEKDPSNINTEVTKKNARDTT